MLSPSPAANLGLTAFALNTTRNQQTTWLRTSAEIYHKRLLLEGWPDLYEIGPVFRNEEVGKEHLPEFTMIEWYRHGFSLRQIEAETLALIQRLCSDLRTAIETRAIFLPQAPPGLKEPASQAEPQYLPYCKLFEMAFGCGYPPSANTLLRLLRDYHAPASTLEKFSEQMLEETTVHNTAWEEALDFLWVSSMETQLLDSHLTIVSAFPAEMAELTSCSPNGMANRSEVYWGRSEVANCGLELVDVAELEQRITRGQLRQEPQLLDAFRKLSTEQAEQIGQKGFAGSALGFDRLIQSILGIAKIEDTLPI